MSPRRTDERTLYHHEQTPSTERPLAPNPQVPQPCGAPSTIPLLLSPPGFQGKLQATDFRGGGECPLALPGRICRETLPPLPRPPAGRAAGPRRGREGGKEGGCRGAPARRSPLPRAPGGTGCLPSLEWEPFAFGSASYIAGKEAPGTPRRGWGGEQHRLPVIVGQIYEGRKVPNSR